MYPQYNWSADKFAHFRGWDDVQSHREFLNWAGKQLKIKEMSDWYKVTQKVKKGEIKGSLKIEPF